MYLPASLSSSTIPALLSKLQVAQEKKGVGKGGEGPSKSAGFRCALREIQTQVGFKLSEKKPRSQCRPMKDLICLAACRSAKIGLLSPCLLGTCVVQP